MRYLLLLTIFSFRTVFAEDNFFSYRLKANDETVVYLEECIRGDCIKIGEENGYEIGNLKFYPGMRKTSAAALAVGETAVGIVGGAATVVGILTVGAGAAASGGSFVFVSSVLSIPIVLYSAAIYVLDVVNPVYWWNKANVAKEITVYEVEIQEGSTIELRSFTMDESESALKYKQQLISLLEKTL